ncbi:MAG: IPTL-CTERM sorting domain-containing protein [Thermoanaerobaculia bacterium]|nr:IPTL-CTERM sorting domain-containing protein [Thermoanaerobaculia bacterium]
MRTIPRHVTLLALLAAVAVSLPLAAATPDERDGIEPGAPPEPAAPAPIARTLAVVPAEIVLAEGEPLAGSTVASLNSPFTNGAGDPGFVAALANGDRVIWSGAGPVFVSSSAVGVTLTGGESTMGIGDAGQFIYSPAVDGDDAVWTQAGALLVDGTQAPGFPAGVTNTFNSRPQMIPSGQAFWVSGFNEAGGTTTQGRMLYTSTDGTPAAIAVVLRSDDLVGGIPIDRPSGIGFDYQFSDNGAHHIHQLLLDTGSTTDDDIVYLDGAIVARETFPTGQGDNWDNFDNVTVNNAGTYAFSGDTDGATASDEFIAVNGGIAVREGASVDGRTLGTAVQALSLNNLDQAAFIWSLAGGGEALFFSCNATNLAADALAVLQTGDEIDFDGGGGDGLFVDDFNASTVIGPGLWLAEDGRVFVEVDLDDGEVTFEAIVGIALPPCPEPEIDVAPAALESTQEPDTVVATSFDIENLGTADLDYLLSEAPADCAAPADVPWLSLDSAGGTLAPSATATIGVTLDSTGLAPGVYTAVICVASNDLDEPTVPVPVSLTVFLAPSVLEIPTLGPTGLGVLVFLLGGAALVLVRRRGRA